MIRLLRFVALRRLRHERLRTLITLLGIALGVGIVLAIELANRATTRSVEVMVDQIAGEARLSVRGDEAGFSESVLGLVAGSPGVSAALPVIEASARDLGTGLTVLVLGVDLLTDTGARGNEAEIDDPLELVTRPDRVLISGTYAADHGLAVGSPLTLLTAAGPKTLAVGGIVTQGGAADALGGKVMLMDIRAAQFLFGRPGRLDRIDIVPVKGVDLLAARNGAGPNGGASPAAELAARLPGSLRVEPPATRAGEAAELLSSFQVNLRMVSTVALFVGMFLVYNTMSIAVVQRRKEIGILRALGVTRRRVLALFTLEGVTYGLAGSALGVLLGIGLARGALLAISKTLGKAYLLSEATAVPLSWPAILAASSLGLAVATAAAFFPGREAAAMPPALTLRQLPFQNVRHDRMRWFVVAGLAMLAVAYGLSRLGPVNGVALFGYVSGFAIVFGFAFFSPPACLLFGRIARAAVGNRFGVEGKLAADNLQRSIGRSSLSVSALLTGLSLVVCVATMIHSFKESIVVWIENTVSADLLVGSDTGEGGTSNIPFHVDFADSLRGVPGVASVNGLRMVHSRYSDQGIALCSLNLGDWLRDNPLVTAKPRLPGPPRADWAVVSENFATRFGKEVGDTLELASPSGPVTLTVAVVFLDYTSDRGTLFLDRATYRRAWGDDLVDTFDLNLADGASAAAVRRTLDERFGTTRRLFVSENAELRRRILTNVDNTFAVVYALEAIALIIAVLGVVNTLVAATLDRRRELGLLRAIGATKTQIGRLFVFEAFGMGIVGVVLGLGAGVALSVLLVTVIQFQSTGWRFLYHFPYASVAVVSLITLLSSAAAGWYPARIGAKTWGAEALQYE